MNEVLIDAHGPDHGLRVEVDGEYVHIADYSEFCEENAETGRWEAVYRETTVYLSELLNPNGIHRGIYMGDDGSPDKRGRERLHDVIIYASISFLAYWGGEETIVDIDRDGGACAFFGEFWGDYAVPGDYQRCSACQDKRDARLRDAVCAYAYGS